MAEARQDEFDEAPGTQPASIDDLEMDSMSTMRPMATQAIFRPHFDDEDSTSVGTEDTEPHDHATAVHGVAHPDATQEVDVQRGRGERAPVGQDR